MALYGRGLFNYVAQEVDELNIEVNQEIELLRLNQDDWWLAKAKGRIGLIPSNYIRVVDPDGQFVDEETDDELSINTSALDDNPLNQHSQSFTELSKFMERRLQEASKLMSIRNSLNASQSLNSPSKDASPAKISHDMRNKVLTSRTSTDTTNINSTKFNHHQANTSKGLGSHGDHLAGRKGKQSIEIVHGIKYYPCKSIVYGPSKASATMSDTPDISMRLEHVYGYTSRHDDSGSNANLTKSVAATGQGHLLFSAGSTIVIMKPPSLKQMFFQEHTAAITSMCIHPAGLFVASAQRGRKGTILVWSISSILSFKMKKVATIKLHMHDVHDSSSAKSLTSSTHPLNYDSPQKSSSSNVVALDFSPDGRYLLAVDSNQNIVIFDWETSITICRNRTGHAHLCCIRFNPISFTISKASSSERVDSVYTLASVGDDMVKFWTLTNTLSEEKVSNPHKYRSPQRPPVESTKEVFILTGAAGNSPKNPALEGAKFTNIEFIPRSASASASSIVATSTNSGAVFLWEQLSHPSLDQSSIAWSTKSRLLSVVLDMHASAITRILYINLPSRNSTNNEELLLSCCKDGEIMLWKISRSNEQPTIALNQVQIPTISLPEDGSAAKAYVIDTTWDESLQAVFLGSSDGAIYKLDTTMAISSSVNSISSLYRMVEGNRKAVTSIASSYSNSYPLVFATACPDEGKVTLWHAMSYQMIVKISIENWIPTAVVFVPVDESSDESSDTLNLIIGNTEAEIAFIAVNMSSSPISYTVIATKKLQSKAPNKAPNSLPTIQTSAMNHLDHLKKNAVKILRFSPDQSFLAVVCENDKIIYILSTANQYRRIMICRGHHHTSTIIAMDISRDSQYLQANDSNHEVLHWEIESGKLLVDGSAVRDTLWDTWTCPYGWPVQGLVQGDNLQLKHRRSNDNHQSAHVVNRIVLNSESLVLASYNSSPGIIKLFRFPCLPQYSCLSYQAHGNDITGFIIMNDDGESKRVVSVCKDGCILQWKLDPN